MEKFFVHCTIGAGMNSYQLVEESSYDKAEELARSLCVELAESYGYYQSEEYFGELDSVAREESWDEDDEEYGDVGFLGYETSYYTPDEHDGYL